VLKSLGIPAGHEHRDYTLQPCPGSTPADRGQHAVRKSPYAGYDHQDEGRITGHRSDQSGEEHSKTGQEHGPEPRILNALKRSEADRDGATAGDRRGDGMLQEDRSQYHYRDRRKADETLARCKLRPVKNK